MKWRIWLLSLGITFICVLIFSFASTQVYYQSSIDKSKEFLHVYMNEYNDGYSFDYDGAVALSQKLEGVRVTFMDSQGKVIADSASEEELPNHGDRSEIVDAILSGEGFAVRSSNTLGKNMVYYCRNYESKLVRLAVFVDSDWKIFVSTLPTLLQFSVIMIALCVILSFVATSFLLKPVKALASDASSGMEVESKYAELKPIAEIINERNRNIQKQIDEIKKEKEIVEKARLSKDEFISNITHEMNTPLTSIHGYAELLNVGGMNEEQKGLAYKTILSQSERLTNLIACIINYSELDNDDLPPYEVNMSALAKEMIAALKPEAEKNEVSIIEKIDEDVIITSRHERLCEIFGNLVRNAIKYNKKGGSITVTLSKENLIVKDTGIGISEENLGKVFSRFFTVDKSHNGKNGGFGLGLAVVKKICDKSGWKISVESKLDVGSKFKVEFE